MDRVDSADLHIAYMTGRRDRIWPEARNASVVMDLSRYWPESRGTTTGQLVAMHLEAESP
jgi:hypothetical protein